jgi:hypothetical protein
MANRIAPKTYPIAPIVQATVHAHIPWSYDRLLVRMRLGHALLFTKRLASAVDLAKPRAPEVEASPRPWRTQPPRGGRV